MSILPLWCVSGRLSSPIWEGNIDVNTTFLSKGQERVSSRKNGKLVYKLPDLVILVRAQVNRPPSLSLLYLYICGSG